LDDNFSNKEENLDEYEKFLKESDEKLKKESRNKLIESLKYCQKDIEETKYLLRIVKPDF